MFLLEGSVMSLDRRSIVKWKKGGEVRIEFLVACAVVLVITISHQGVIVRVGMKKALQAQHYFFLMHMFQHACMAMNLPDFSTVSRMCY